MRQLCRPTCFPPSTTTMMFPFNEHSHSQSHSRDLIIRINQLKKQRGHDWRGCRRGYSQSALAHRPQSSWNVPAALTVLELTAVVPPPPSKDVIQQSFNKAAKRYHPDAKHNAESQPCPIKFRQVCEARDYLLDHYYDGPYATSHLRRDLHRYHRRPSPARGARGTAASTAPTRKFAQGFPTQTLQVLTLRQNLAIRGTIGASILLLVAYDLLVMREGEGRGRQYRQDQHT